jgi:hypothetical protein
MVAKIVELSKSLGICTVAECVETPGQVAILREIGVQVAQGFLFARPLSAATAAALANANPSISLSGIAPVRPDVNGDTGLDDRERRARPADARADDPLFIQLPPPPSAPHSAQLGHGPPLGHLRPVSVPGLRRDGVEAPPFPSAIPTQSQSATLIAALATTSATLAPLASAIADLQRCLGIPDPE